MFVFGVRSTDCASPLTPLASRMTLNKSECNNGKRLLGSASRSAAFVICVAQPHQSYSMLVRMTPLCVAWLDYRQNTSIRWAPRSTDISGDSFRFRCHAHAPQTPEVCRLRMRRVGSHSRAWFKITWLSLIHMWVTGVIQTCNGTIIGRRCICIYCVYGSTRCPPVAATAVWLHTAWEVIETKNCNLLA